MSDILPPESNSEVIQPKFSPKEILEAEKYLKKENYIILSNVGKISKFTENQTWIEIGEGLFCFVQNKNTDLYFLILFNELSNLIMPTWKFQIEPFHNSCLTDNDEKLLYITEKNINVFGLDFKTFSEKEEWKKVFDKKQKERPTRSPLPKFKKESRTLKPNLSRSGTMPKPASKTKEKTPHRNNTINFFAKSGNNENNGSKEENNLKNSIGEPTPATSTFNIAPDVVQRPPMSMSTTTVPPPPPPPPPVDFFKITNVPAEVHSNERNNLMKDIQSGIKLKKHVPPNVTISKLPDSGVNTVENVSSQPPPLPSSPYPSEPSQTAYTVKIIPSQIQETNHSTGLLPSQNLETNGTSQIIKPPIFPKPKILPNDETKIEKKEYELSKNLNVSEQLTTTNANVNPCQSTSTLTSHPQPQQPVTNAAEALRYLMDNKFKDQINERRSRFDSTSDDEKNKSGKNSFDNGK